MHICPQEIQDFLQVVYMAMVVGISNIFHVCIHCFKFHKHIPKEK